MNPPSSSFNFQQAARAEMLREGFQPDFPPPVVAEVKAFTSAALPPASRDLRNLLWSSIDNTDSRDLDQVEWAERLPDGKIRVLVGIADVDAVVKPGSATDSHARQNATSVYSGGPVYSMLPERLSTDLTSLRQDEDRAAVVMEFVVADNGDVVCADVFAATLRNRAKLNYDAVGKWLDTQEGAPSCEMAMPEGLCDQLRLQKEAGQRLKRFRLENGALTLGGVESVPIVVDNQVQKFAILQENSARDIIESFMIAANVAMARYLRAQNSPCLRRVVRTPKRWDRIQEIALKFGVKLPVAPDPRPLGEFLSAQQKADPTHFPELSLAVLKAMGPGEYIVEHPGTEQVGHFGLALNDYTHSTAPNRRYADLVVQRLLKASIGKAPQPYSEAELSDLAAHCTDREAAARKVERFMTKVAAAAMLAPQIGHQFDAIVTGATPKGTFARLLTVPAEGRIMRGERGLDVGDKVRVRLTGVNANLGFIDFERVELNRAMRKNPNTRKRLLELFVLVICGALVFAGFALALLRTDYIGELYGGLAGGVSKVPDSDIIRRLLFFFYLVSVPALVIGRTLDSLSSGTFMLTNSIVGAIVFPLATYCFQYIASVVRGERED